MGIDDENWAKWRRWKEAEENQQRMAEEIRERMKQQPQRFSVLDGLKLFVLLLIAVMYLLSR